MTCSYSYCSNPASWLLNKQPVCSSCREEIKRARYVVLTDLTPNPCIIERWQEIQGAKSDPGQTSI
jgi:hypothetical protein